MKIKVRRFCVTPSISIIFCILQGLSKNQNFIEISPRSSENEPLKVGDPLILLIFPLQIYCPKGLLCGDLKKSMCVCPFVR